MKAVGRGPSHHAYNIDNTRLNENEEAAEVQPTSENPTEDAAASIAVWPVELAV